MVRVAKTLFVTAKALKKKIAILVCAWHKQSPYQEEGLMIYFYIKLNFIKSSLGEIGKHGRFKICFF